MLKPMEKEAKKQQIKTKQATVETPQSEKQTIVPRALDKLIKLLCKAFYEPELIIVVNSLLAWHCVKRADLELLLAYSKTGMEAALNTLESDKIIKRKTFYSTGASNETGRTEAWYVNYGGIVNIIRFKLYKVQAKIQVEQKLATSKASYTCEQCGKTFTELHMDRLMTPEFFNTGVLTCTHCAGTVIENEKDDASDKRNLAEQFNEQRKKFDDLLLKLEGVRLHEDLCNPLKIEVVPHLSDSKYGLQRAKDRVQDLRKGLVSPVGGYNDMGEFGGDDPNKVKEWRTGYKFDDSKMYNSNLEIEILSHAEQRKKQLLANQVAKEVPRWMRVSTIKGADKDANHEKDAEVKNCWDDWYDEEEEDVFDEEEEIGKKGRGGGGGGGRWAQKRNEEVQKLCFQYEKKNQGDDSDSDSDDSDDEMNYEIRFPDRHFQSIRTGRSFSYKDILMEPDCFHLLKPESQEEFRRFIQMGEYPSDKIMFLTNIS